MIAEKSSFTGIWNISYYIIEEGGALYRIYQGNDRELDGSPVDSLEAAHELIGKVSRRLVSLPKCSHCGYFIKEGTQHLPITDTECFTAEAIPDGITPR